MNDDYAKAYYNIQFTTPRLNVFKAQSGVRDVDVSMALVIMFSRHVGMTFFGSGAQLLGDAKDSPLTQSSFQPQGGAILFYNF
jgi:outer membrane scaffolding protein for murein synthesis (MipA/OmpV family)